MSEILVINACARESSRTWQLCETLLSTLQGDRQVVQLYELPLQPLDACGLQQRDQASQTQDFSNACFDLAKQFAQADCIVIAAPYWDLLFPAVLRTYLEQICVAGITFRYSPEGRPIGLCKAKKLYYITTAGGYIGENDFGYDYVRALSQTMLGIKETTRITAEGLDVDPNQAEQILQQAKQSIRTA